VQVLSVLADLQWNGVSTAPKHSLEDAAGLQGMRAMDSTVAAIRQAAARKLVTHNVGEHAQRTILQCIMMMHFLWSRLRGSMMAATCS
jgi:hypothetical protein